MKKRDRIERNRQRPCPEDRRPDIFTDIGQGTALWKHVFTGTSTCIQMIEQYAEVGLPGFERAKIESLRDRLSKVIYEDNAANKRPTSSGESDDQGADVPTDDDVQPGDDRVDSAWG